jgi:glycosyltransferase involved in cell wall biosynthesis
MRSALRESRPDLLHVQCFGINGVYATALSTIAGVPLIVTLQGETFMDDHDIYARSSFLRAGLRLGVRRARAVTACSRFTLDDATERFGLPRRKSQVVFNGVDLDEAEKSAQPPAQRFIFGLGRVVYRKGFDLLVEAWAMIAEDHRDVTLVLAGAGPELSSLESLVVKKGLTQRVQFVGPLSRADVAATMSGAEVFVMPSRVEAFGMVTLEAWRAGTPVIVSANGGAPEFVDDGVTGLVVDPTDTSALAGALARLLTDERLRTELASTAAERLPDFQWSAIGRQYERVYEAALGGSYESR